MLIIIYGFEFIINIKSSYTHVSFTSVHEYITIEIRCTLSYMRLILSLTLILLEEIIILGCPNKIKSVQLINYIE